MSTCVTYTSAVVTYALHIQISLKQAPHHACTRQFLLPSPGCLGTLLNSTASQVLSRNRPSSLRKPPCFFSTVPALSHPRHV